MGENHVTSSTNHIQGNWNGHNWNYLKMNGNLFDIFIKATCETEFVIWIYSKYKWNMETVYSEPLKAYLWGVTHETAYSGSKDGSAFKFSCLSERYCFCDGNCKTRACKNWGHQRVTLSKCARLSKQGKVFLTPSPFLSLRSDEHTEVVRGLAWSPVDDTLYTSGWGQQIFSHAFDCGEPSDLNVEASISQATSVCMDMDSVNQTHFNGDLNGMSLDDENGEETMEVEGHGATQKTVSSNVGTDSSVGTVS